MANSRTRCVLITEPSNEPFPLVPVFKLTDPAIEICGESLLAVDRMEDEL